jgi:hypothetical protein
MVSWRKPETKNLMTLSLYVYFFLTATNCGFKSCSVEFDVLFSSGYILFLLKRDGCGTNNF